MADGQAQQQAQPGVDTKPEAQQAKPESIDELRSQLSAVMAEKDKLAKVVNDRNAEAKANREKAEKAEREKLESSGNLQALLEAEKKRATELEARAKVADEIEPVVKGLAEKRLAALPEGLRAKLSGLPVAMQLSLADDLVPAAGPAASVKAPTTGKPAPAAQDIDLTKLSADDVAKLSPDQRRAALRRALR